jgi:hypothetical protein
MTSSEPLVSAVARSRALIQDRSIVQARTCACRVRTLSAARSRSDTPYCTIRCVVIVHLCSRPLRSSCACVRVCVCACIHIVLNLIA